MLFSSSSSIFFICLANCSSCCINGVCFNISSLSLSFSSLSLICCVVFSLACFCVMVPNANLDLLVAPSPPCVGNGIII